MKSFKENKKPPRKRLLVLLFLCVLLLVLLGGVFWYMTSARNDTSTPEDDTVNLEPATDEERQNTEDYKRALAEKNDDRSDNPETNRPTVSDVTVVITNVSVDSINAYVSGIFEDDGTCTAIFTQDGRTFEKSSLGFKNASYTQCAPIFLSRSDFPYSGTWQVVVRYASQTSKGTSQAQTLTIQ